MRLRSRIRTVDDKESDNRIGSKGAGMHTIRTLGSSFATALVVAAVAASSGLANVDNGTSPVTGDSGGQLPRFAIHSASPVRLTGDSGGQLPRFAIEPVHAEPAATSGFDWGDAAIGGGFVSALVLAGGIVLVVRRRHDHLAPA
jgi:hypothetical protein